LRSFVANKKTAPTWPSIISTNQFQILLRSLCSFAAISVAALSPGPRSLSPAWRHAD
jgi:hypothetical protein